MIKNNILFSVFLIVLQSATFIIYAQDKPMENKEDKTKMQQMNLQSCMDKIVANSTLRTQIMMQMIENTKNDSSGMMQMCKMMMDNPEMHSMMKKMMIEKSTDNEGLIMKDKKMKHDKEPEGNKKSEQEEHHK